MIGYAHTTERAMTDAGGAGARPWAGLARLLLVEDNEALAFGLRRTLEGEGYAVEVAGDGAEALRRARAGRPDLILLDLMLPGVDGYGVLQRLRDEGDQTPVLILTARSQEADKVYGFRLGADDYVTKPFGLSELVARVAALLRRARTAAPSPGPAAAAAGGVYAFGDVELNAAARSVSKGGAPVAVTPKEFDLLLAMVRRPGQVISRLALLRDVWGHQAEVMTRTVDIHVAELRRKLEDSPAAPRHIVTVWKAGYRFDP